MGIPQNNTDILKDSNNDDLEKNGKYEYLLDLIPEGVLIHRSGVIIDVNRVLVSMLEYSRYELIGMDMKKMNFPSASYKSIHDRLANGNSIDLEIELFKKDGSLITAELKVKKLGCLQHQGIDVLTLKDLTSRIKSDRQIANLTKAVNQSYNSIVLTDRKGYIEYVNPYFTKLTGYSFDEVRGRNPRIFSSGLHDKEFYACLWSCLKKDGIWKGDLCNTSKKGTQFWERASISVIRNKNGSITNYLAIKEDVTEKRRIEEHIKRTNQELKKAIIKAEESERLKSAFLANVSHEIRTPLNAIVGFSGIIAKFTDDPEMDKYADMILKQSDILLQLINDILDLSRLESNTMTIQNNELELNSLVDELYEMFKVKCPSNIKLIPLRLNGFDTVCSDRVRLSQVFINLITNAIKFTKEGKVAFGFLKNDKEEIIGFVADTGIGISEEMQKQIFEPFRKLNTYAQGTGLGLSIVKLIIETMKGEIWLESEPEQGTDFYFKIPFEEV